LSTLEFKAPRLGARLVQQPPRRGPTFDRARFAPPEAVTHLFAGQPRQQGLDHHVALLA
jgi:hypothetical protein